MAKLSARGRSEVARFTKERDIEGDELVTWRRKERALMSDGTVLEKLTVRFKASTYSAAYLHNYGWKVRGKLKATATAATWAQSYRDMGWTTTSGEPAEVAKPKVSARQIEAACQADDGSGFCRTCGAHVYGVEPDARGYTCEGCGKPEVYGAEELLLMGA
jgi:hypothetical protein